MFSGRAAAASSPLDGNETWDGCRSGRHRLALVEGAARAQLDVRNRDVPAVVAGIPIVLVSTATYPSLGVEIPAALSKKVVGTLLRGRLGFRGVVITDALDTDAVTKYEGVPEAALSAIDAGVDMVLAAVTAVPMQIAFPAEPMRICSTQPRTGSSPGRLSSSPISASFR